jgi:hypothetical protein
MAFGDLGISHMGIALMVAQIGQWRKELWTRELDNYQFGSRTGKLPNHQVEAFCAGPI